jgi:Ca-activated chloride channel family protein
MGGAQTDLVYPRGSPDVFRGSQVTLIGRYSNAADLNSVQLKLTGRSGGTTRTYTYTNLNFPLRSDANEYLPRLWATRRVGWLMEQVRSNGEQKELRDEIVDLGTRYGIVTPYTSYLALENAVTITDSGAQPMVRGAADTTQGFSGLVMNAPSASPAPKVRMQTGAGAVRQSKVAREQQEAERLKDDDTRKDAVRRVEGKTFYLINGVWTDSEFKAVLALPETTVVFGSDEYFALVKQNPKLGGYFSLGERVVVVFEGRVYRVTIQ